MGAKPACFTSRWTWRNDRRGLHRRHDGHRDHHFRPRARWKVIIGGKPGPGRPRGARSKLGEAFLEDLRDAWLEHGAEALRRCARDEPAQFVRVVAGLMPKDINLNLSTDPAAFAATFKEAVELLGNQAPVLPRHPMKVIDGRKR